jgi:hypothetical protein
MSYIITAEVCTHSEVNIGADRTKVKARILSEHNGYITFDVQGDFDTKIQRELVVSLCRDLTNAGFLEFKISHSY